MKEKTALALTALEAQLPAIRTEMPVTTITQESAYAHLATWQRRPMVARLCIVNTIKTLCRATGLSRNMVARKFIDMLQSGTLPEHLHRAAVDANVRKGKKRTLSRAIIYKWLNKHEQGTIALAPKENEPGELFPPWLMEFLTLYRQPQKPSIPQCLEWMAEAREQEGRSLADMPSYSKVNRFLKKKFSFLDQNRGRMTGSELRAIRVYTIRDASELEPLDIVCGDGHSWKSKVAHPNHGRPFNPEVEGIIDVATRMLVGWSAGLAESAQVVADALRYTVTVNERKPYGGIPAVYYSDHGAGNMAHRIEDPLTGTLARLHTTPLHSIPGMPQSRGVIERAQSSVWIRAAKEHASFSGKDMDSLALRRVTKIIEKDIKEGRTPRGLMSWAQFIEFLAFHANAYNNRPHSALPKITDPETGLRRHLKPQERWAQFMEKGWKPLLMDPDELDDLFRPQEIVETKRGLLNVQGNQYSHSDLEHYHGQKVIAEYEVQEAERVRVRDLDGRLICIAEFEGNKRRWIPKTFQDITRERRAQGREKRLQIKLEEVRAEARGVVDVEEQIPEECCITDAGCTIPDTRSEQNPESDILNHASGDGSRPLFPDEIARYEWHLKNGFPTDDDLKFKLSFEQTDSYRMLESYWR